MQDADGACRNSVMDGEAMNFPIKVSGTASGASSAFPSTISIALAGMLALAVAMGIGRFAFTPVFPMMLQDRELSLVDGSWLASSNYVGYLAGALAARWVAGHEQRTIGLGLLTIGAVTLPMATPLPLAAMLGLRFVAGVASALVLVSVSAWALATLAGRQRSALNGAVFSGVGVGIVATGIVCIGLVALDAGSAAAWLILGLMALAVPLTHWKLLLTPLAVADAAPAGPVAGSLPTSARWATQEWRMVLCYGAFGFGYIIPATFLPVMATQVFDDPRMVGLAWPVFGLAAAVSTLVASRLLRRWSSARLWLACHWVMAVAIALAATTSSAASILFAALAVGGTFMLITLCAMQEAKRIAGARATPLMAGMTSAFALGQIGGPLCIGLGLGADGDFAPGLLLAVAVLVVSAIALASRNGTGER